MMSPAEKERLLNDAFATVASTLVREHDLIEFLQTLVELSRDVTGSSEVGLLLIDDAGRLEVVTSTRENGDLIETMELGAEAGPCHESFRTGRIITDPDIAASPTEWASFRDAALLVGLRSVVSVPMRVGGTTIGVLSLYRDRITSAGERDLRAAQALADIATIGILNERQARDAGSLEQQLALTLNRRIVVEQAKGVLAQLHGITPDAAFTEMRLYARAQDLPLNEVAAGLVNRTLSF